MKHFYTFLLLLFLWSGMAQDQAWKGHFSYTSIKDIVEGNGNLYVAAENAVYFYNPSTEEVTTYTSIEGLTAETISAIHFSTTINTLFIGYENGIIDVLNTSTGEVLTVVDIFDKPSLPPNVKKINHFNQYNGNLYISTGFGIALFNLQDLEFGDTYFIGNQGASLEITQTTIFQDHIYASTFGGGVRRADINNDNLIDFAQWSEVRGGNYHGVQVVGNSLFAARQGGTILKLNTDTDMLVAVDQLMTAITDFSSYDNTLTVATPSKTIAYNEEAQILDTFATNPAFSFFATSVFAINQTLYTGTREKGLLAHPFAAADFIEILPNGPIRNDPFALDIIPGQLWVSYGEVSVTYNPFPLTQRGISRLNEEGWKNIPYDSLFGATDIVHVAINPANPSETYMTSFIKGILKLENDSPAVLINETNSPLSFPGGNAAIGLRMFGATFDNTGTLWLTQSRTNEGLIKLSPEGSFQFIDVSSVIDGVRELAFTEIEISREGFVFFGTSEGGLIGYDPATNRFNRIDEGESNGNLPSTTARALAFDANNRLWIGTLEGLRVLFNPNAFFDDGANAEAQEIIILDNGIPQELLFQLPITDIEVDGSNNKWIATATAGVFQVSPNGQETLAHFTKENSPLPSNNVQDVAIDDDSGEIYFATNKGLVSYQGTATAPSTTLENLHAYPNPVRPNFNGNVTIAGLTTNANVKITDVSGNLVFEDTAVGGSLQWDTTAFGRHKVASGVYLIIVTSADGFETKVSKIMIVR